MKKKIVANTNTQVTSTTQVDRSFVLPSSLQDTGILHRGTLVNGISLFGLRRREDRNVLAELSA